MIHRQLTDKLKESAGYFPVVTLLGPRQSGKTTLVKTVFNKHNYVSVEDFDVRMLANTDPRLFFETYANDSGLIIGEIQHAPELLSYIQTIVDREKKKGYFILTGSQNILVNRAITQSLAGRMAILTLFPLSISELRDAELLPETLEDALLQGSYPSVFSDKTPPLETYRYYIRSYIERDVRDLKNISNLSLFKHFLQLCAGRSGQLVNFTSLGNDLGVDHKTISSWVSILEATYVIFLLYPYNKNITKRVTKTPKLYFVDTGIACSLLNIKTLKELRHHPLRGSLIETYIISDLFKQYYNLNLEPSLYFWRDHAGNEIDCIVDEALYTIPVEIKSSKTSSPEFFKQLQTWKTIASTPSPKSYVMYGGEQNTRWPDAELLSWKSFGTLIQSLSKLTEELPPESLT